MKGLLLKTYLVYSITTEISVLGGAGYLIFKSWFS